MHVVAYKCTAIIGLSGNIELFEGLIQPAYKWPFFLWVPLLHCLLMFLFLFLLRILLLFCFVLLFCYYAYVTYVLYILFTSCLIFSFLATSCWCSACIACGACGDVSVIVRKLTSCWSPLRPLLSSSIRSVMWWTSCRAFE